MAGQGVLVCRLSKIDVNEKWSKCISAVAPTLSRASISGNSVSKSNTSTHQRPFPLLVCLLLQVILFGQSESGRVGRLRHTQELLTKHAVLQS